MQTKLLIALLGISIQITGISQDNSKKTLEIISNELSNKMTLKGKKKVVVLFVTDNNKVQTNFGKYIADVVSYYIVNDPNNFSVFDRENLSGIVEAKKLISEGYIDAINAKQLGKILSVDAIIIGNYIVLSKTISLTLKALEVSDGFVISQILKEVPIDNDVASLLGISPLDEEGNNITNKGFNRPLNNNENYNNPTSVSPECFANNTGDYCFENKLRAEVTVYISGLNKELTLKPGQTQCIYNCKAEDWKYEYYETNTTYFYSTYKGKGVILIEKCKSKTFVIR